MSATVVIEDKTPLLTSFILPLLSHHVSRNPTPNSPPFFLGISGPQGSGKTSLVTVLAANLRALPHNLNVVVFSIDDIYLTHTDQAALRELYPGNKLVFHRGEPGTHDVNLGKQVFQSLKEQKQTKIPIYDKSASNGQGDRVDEVHWENVNGPYDLVIFEGWCVGFQPLLDEVLEEKWQESRQTHKGTVGRHALQHLQFVNTKLKDYDSLVPGNVAIRVSFRNKLDSENKSLTKKESFLDALIHIDAENISYVYDWRIQQEHSLIASHGSGMTNDQVTEFVDGYMPAYELFVDSLRQGAFKEKGKQLRVVIGKDRNIVKVLNL